MIASVPLPLLMRLALPLSEPLDPMTKRLELATLNVELLARTTAPIVPFPPRVPPAKVSVAFVISDPIVRLPVESVTVPEYPLALAILRLPLPVLEKFALPENVEIAVSVWFEEISNWESPFSVMGPTVPLPDTMPEWTRSEADDILEFMVNRPALSVAVPL